MAIQTKRLAQFQTQGQIWFEVFIEYEDTDYREINDDGEPDDFRLIRFFGTNYAPKDLTILIQRGNRGTWFENVIPAGESFTQNAGGPVRYETDIPNWTYTYN